MGAGGVLEFTLGLQVNEFLSKLGLASGELLSLAGVGEALHKAMEKVFQAFEQGAALEHLSRRTGETAGNLYRLQAGLEAAGASAESMPSMLFLMQKALGGVSEMGESTADVFHKLGLNISELKRLGPAEAFGKIMERMGGLSQDSATKAASMLFGRMGAASAVQVSRSPQEFREAFADAARQADIFERAGTAFAKIERTIGSIKRELAGFWAGIAEGAAPAVQTILDWLRKIDLTSIGVRFGHLFDDLAKMIRDEDFGKVLELSLNAGMERAANFMVQTLAGVSAAIRTMMHNALKPDSGGATGSGNLKGLGYAAMGAGPAVLGAGSQIQQWIMPTAENAARLKERIGQVDFWMQKADDALGNKGGKLPFQDAMSGVPEAFQKAFSAQAGSFGDAAQKAFTAFLSKPRKPLSGAGKDSGDSGSKSGEDEIQFGGGLNHRTEGNVFEKMGFNMGGEAPMNKVAMNTARTVELLTDIRHCFDVNPTNPTIPMEHAVV